MRGWLPLVLALGLVAPRVVANEPAADEAGRFLTGPLRKLDDFLLRCPEELLVDVAPGAPCTVLQTYLLGSIGTTAFGAVKYGRDDRSGEAVNDLVVLALFGDGRARAFWYGSVAIAYQRIEKVDVVDVPQGPFFDVQYCVQGTGGCSQTTFVRRGSAWKPLRRDATWDAVYAAVPRPYAPHKSEPIDFRRMRWTQSFRGPSDANCCPSASVEFELDVVGDALTVKSHRFVSAPAP